MARVSGATASRAAGRGQLLLLSALGLAALLVVLALVLNTVIYTENAAARETAARDAADLLRAQHQAQGVAETAIAAENDGGHRTYATMHGNLSRQLSIWSNLSARHGARTGRHVALDLVSTRNGTRIVQDTQRNFTNANGVADWNLGAGVTAVRAFELTVERSSLAAPPSGANASVLIAADAFAVTVNNGSQLRTFVYRDGSDVVVTVTDDEGVVIGDCRVTNSTATIDLANGTVDATACPALADVLSVASGAEIDYQNGHNVAGTYESVIDVPANDGDVVGPGDGSGQPRAERLLFDATVTFTVTAPDVAYESRLDHLGGARR